ncbi:UNVERIFIED_CONTAM: hypothetical protein GTU68_059544 [Idotea baltica]|nr:hypothetical protein [Idotea baltica]
MSASKKVHSKDIH